MVHDYSVSPYQAKDGSRINCLHLYFMWLIAETWHGLSNSNLILWIVVLEFEQCRSDDDVNHLKLFLFKNFHKEGNFKGRVTQKSRLGVLGVLIIENVANSHKFNQNPSNIENFTIYSNFLIPSQ